MPSLGRSPSPSVHAVQHPLSAASCWQCEGHWFCNKICVYKLHLSWFHVDGRGSHELESIYIAHTIQFAVHLLTRRACIHYHDLRCKTGIQPS